MAAFTALLFISFWCILIPSQAMKIVESTSIYQHLRNDIDYCNPNDYRAGHTMCLYKERKLGPDCANRKNAAIFEFSNEIKAEIINAHNQYRSNVALGKETRGNPGPQPQAANMNSVAWDEELATIAERFAIQCKEFEAYAHDWNRDVVRFGTNGVGQNGMPGYGFVPEKGSPTNGWKYLVETCYEEVVYMDPSSFTESYHANYASNKKDVIGHYRQVVYGAISHIGCGGMTWVDEWDNPKITVYCNYGRTWNPGNEATYVVGPPASQCPNTTKGNQETGLCEPL